MNAIRTFGNWVRSHPFKAVGFTWLLTLFITLNATRTVAPWMWWVPVAITLLLLIIMRKDARNKVIATVLALTMLQLAIAPTPARAKTENAALIVAIIVIVVGGVVSCKVVRFCQKNFPPTPTNAPPGGGGDDSGGSGLYFVLSGDDSAAASYSGNGIEYCWEETWPADSDPESQCDDCDPTTNETSSASAMMDGLQPSIPGPLPAPMSLWATSEQPPAPSDLSIWTMVASHQDGRGVVRSAGFVPRGTNGELPLISRDEFLSRIGTFGISLGGGGGISYYGRGGLPCAPEDCPIMFVPDPAHPGGMPQVLIKAYDRPQRIVVIQRSRDLRNWTTVMRTIVPEGMGVDFQDMTRYSKAFYRVKVQVND